MIISTLYMSTIVASVSSYSKRLKAGIPAVTNSGSVYRKSAIQFYTQFRAKTKTFQACMHNKRELLHVAGFPMQYHVVTIIICTYSLHMNIQQWT